MTLVYRATPRCVKFRSWDRGIPRCGKRRTPRRPGGEGGRATGRLEGDPTPVVRFPPGEGGAVLSGGTLEGGKAGGTPEGAGGDPEECDLGPEGEGGEGPVIPAGDGAGVGVRPSLAGGEDGEPTGAEVLRGYARRVRLAGEGDGGGRLAGDFHRSPFGEGCGFGHTIDRTRVGL